METLSKKIDWWRVLFSEKDRQCVSDAMQNECISMGSVTQQFESALSNQLKIPYVVATTSGSMALLMTFIALGLGPEDEIIIPNRTWIAAAHAAMMLKAKIILVDVLPDVPVMDVAQLEKKITAKTKNNFTYTFKWSRYSYRQNQSNCKKI